MLNHPVNATQPVIPAVRDQAYEVPHGVVPGGDSDTTRKKVEVPLDFTWALSQY